MASRKAEHTRENEEIKLLTGVFLNYELQAGVTVKRATPRKTLSLIGIGQRDSVGIVVL